MTLILDAGALIALERRESAVVAHLRDAARSKIRVVTSAAVAAQAWRGGTRQAGLARTLRGVAVRGLTDQTYRPVGELLAANGTADVADAHLSLLVQTDDTVLTSDPDDIKRLLRTRGVVAAVIAI